MTETWVEGGMLIIMTLISLAVGYALLRNARAHERSAHKLDAKIARAGINLRRG
jgi:hypothetical protein